MLYLWSSATHETWLVHPPELERTFMGGRKLCMDALPKTMTRHDIALAVLGLVAWTLGFLILGLQL